MNNNTTMERDEITKPLPVAQVIIRDLIGSRIVCTLKDGRRTTGSLICIDRLKNMILSDCTEERVINSVDYTYNRKQPSVKRTVSRQLQQAMIPGNYLLSVKIDRSIYQKKIAPRLDECA